MSINLLKRLESSVYSFDLTLKRIYELIKETLKTIDEYEKNGETTLDIYDVSESEFDIEDSNSDLFTVGKKVKIDLGDMDYKTSVSYTHLAYMITSYEDAERYFGRKADKNRKIYNGMLKTYFYQFLGPKPPRQSRYRNRG